jgi:ribosomal-protein-alanine N-acetyltransferase
MEHMPYRDLDTPLNTNVVTEELSTTAGDSISDDWRHRLPVLTGGQVVLRQLRPSDAASLFAMLTTEEVARFISPPPSTVEGFERFIAWTHRQQALRKYVCYAVTVKGFDTAIGIFQVHETEAGFATAEWGFAIGSAFWGTGVFQDAAELVLDFVFEKIGVHRLEARATVRNGRGNGALTKIGAVHEAVLRKSFLRNGEYLDQVLYAIVDGDWRARRDAFARRPTVRIH